MHHKVRISSATGSMRRDMLPALRRSIALVLIIFMAAGCSKAVEIQRSEIGEPAYREAGSYRIRLQGHNEYLARRFSVTDSTIVVEELLPSDERYRLERVDLPIVIPLSAVEYVSRLQTNVGATIGIVTVAGLLIALVYVLETAEWDIE
jgi:hypothetical protein